MRNNHVVANGTLAIVITVTIAIIPNCVISWRARREASERARRASKSQVVSIDKSGQIRFIGPPPIICRKNHVYYYRGERYSEYLQRARK